MPYGEAGVPELPEGEQRTAQQTLILAGELLRTGRPFHAHEVFEDAWKAGPAAERELWRGLAQLAVGVTHAARGNAVGAARLIDRGAANLASYAGEAPHGLDVPALLAWCRDAVAAVQRGDPPPILPL